MRCLVMGNRALSLLIIVILLAGGGFFAYQSYERGLALESTISSLAVRLAELVREHEAAIANERDEGKLAREESGKKEAEFSRMKIALKDAKKERDRLRENVKKREDVLAGLRSALAGTSTSAAEDRLKLARTRKLLATAEEKRRATLARAETISAKAREEAERARKLEASLAEISSKYKSQIISLHKTREMLQIQIVDKLLFDVGSATLREAGLEALDRIASTLKTQPSQKIRVEGHTDNLPIRGGLARRYPSNWELSAARAIAVVQRLEAQGIPPGRLSATGYAFHRPVADNATAVGRARNRRIEILMSRKRGEK
jgi:chemotaxis protein MotB